MILSTTPFAFCIRGEDDRVIHTGLIHPEFFEDMMGQLMEEGDTVALVIASDLIH